ncbi:hypothetical protein B566_EDAN011966 [Ephemera danica]|nr:hypothetical protein B566_EDAN011966 [Ephemera danica]
MLTEGVYLHKNGISPYDGDLFHETPLGLQVFSWILELSPFWIDFIFVATDMLTGILLQFLASTFVAQAVAKEKQNKHRYAADSQNVLLTESQVRLVPLYVACAYNCNPYSVLSCVGHTTTVFNNFCLALAFLSMSKGWMIFCCLGLALATYQAFYPVMFIVPACMYLVQVKHPGKSEKHWPTVILTVTMFITMLVYLMFISYQITNNWAFIDATYKFM